MPAEPRAPQLPADGLEVGAAYDGVAAGYDSLVVEDAWMREVLWAHYARAFAAAHRVLDVGCGTGLDTLFLAARGIQVTGIDASAAMIERLREKARRSGLEARVEALVEDAARLSAWPAGGFDGIVSGFAGLNTVDLGRFAADASRLVRPGGRLVLHLLAPEGVWARLRRLVRGDWRGGATAHEPRSRERTVTIGGRPIRHALLPAAETYRRCFAAHFSLLDAYGQGFLWPRRSGRRLPLRLRRALGRLEARLGRHRPFLDWGRFFVLDLERRPSD
ncbi:MAG TPA: class I SAM-dependent methyltransferase [Thermoanaerobaculia bacterium]|nr:class I SAM-dependent methyltransferase [Thermoanaerobaculia bacterium]